MVITLHNLVLQFQDRLSKLGWEVSGSQEVGRMRLQCSEINGFLQSDRSINILESSGEQKKKDLSNKPISENKYNSDVI